MHTDWSSLSLWFFQLWWFRLTFNKNPPIHYLNKLEYFIRPIKKTFLVNCWPSGKYVNLLYMYSILGRGSFCFNQFGVAWRWSVCGTAEVVWKPRFLWQWPSAHLHCWVWCLSSSSWQYSIDSLWGSGLPLFLQTLGPWFPNEMQNLLSSEKRTLDHWVLFLHSPGKTLLTLSLVQKWLGSPFPEDVWAWWLLMHWLQLQSTPCEALTSVWISFAWLYSQACSHLCCLCTFSYPNSSFQSTLHLICFDTALCKQPHLSVMTFCDLPSLWRVSMFVFWIIAKSAVFSIIVVSKNKRYPEFIL